MARARGEATFLVYEDERWSFADVMAKVDALGAALVRTYGVAPGDRVAIAMRNYPEWVVAFAAITSVGAISVSLNAWWTTDELDYALGDSGSQVVIADAERVERVAPILGKHGARRSRCATSGALPACAAHWDDVVLDGAPLPEVDVRPDDGRDDPLHLGHDRPPEGRRLDAPRGALRRSWASRAGRR